VLSFAKWLKKTKPEGALENATSHVNAYFDHRDEKAAMLGFSKPLSFGKHKGKTFIAMWKDPEQRSYLEWIAEKEWCYEDVKRTIQGLQKHYPTKTSRHGPKAGRVKSNKAAKVAKAATATATASSAK